MTPAPFKFASLSLFGIISPERVSVRFLDQVGIKNGKKGRGREIVKIT